MFDGAAPAAVASTFREHSWNERLIGFFSPWAAASVAVWLPLSGAVPIPPHPVTRGPARAADSRQC